MNISDFISELNKDLSLEYAAAIQYYQHAAMIRGVEFFAVIAELETHAGEELGHAKTIIDLIVELGGVPGIEVGPRYTSIDNLSMINQDLDGEKLAIARYEERIRQARELSVTHYDFEHAVQVIRSILGDEIHHRTDLLTILGRK